MNLNLFLRVLFGSSCCFNTFTYLKSGNHAYMGIGRTFSSRGALGDFFLHFSRGSKVVKFDFSHSKLRKQPFLLGISKSGGKGPPLPLLPTPMHVQGVSQLLKQSDWAQIQDFK